MSSKDKKVLTEAEMEKIAAGGKTGNPMGSWSGNKSSSHTSSPSSIWRPNPYTSTR